MKGNSESKIRELFHYFNIQADIDSVYGQWAVAKNGDVVNYIYPYAILAIHHYDCDWSQIVKSKVWFCYDNMVDLEKALKRAGTVMNFSKIE